MTKKVRIENADTNDYVEVVIEVFDKDYKAGEEVKTNTVILGYPTQMHEETIWDGKRVVITERKKNVQR